ncbi:hypothetical protein AB0I60_34620 [Actinosynnema sp. NPDC050436]|uniref:hypothetical protein n=1 Tax=Actinosynnema sp. NPDC050436 TaxID=3155659 RepID=UPI0033DEFA92
MLTTPRQGFDSTSDSQRPPNVTVLTAIGSSGGTGRSPAGTGRRKATGTAPGRRKRLTEQDKNTIRALAKIRDTRGRAIHTPPAIAALVGCDESTVRTLCRNEGREPRSVRMTEAEKDVVRHLSACRDRHGRPRFSARDIALVLGRHLTTVQRQVYRERLQPAARFAARERALVLREAAAAHAAGTVVNVEALSRRLGCSRTAVVTVLDTHRAPRIRHRAMTLALRQRIVELYTTRADHGRWPTVGQVAAGVDRSHSTVTRVLTEAGITIRPAAGRGRSLTPQERATALALYRRAQACKPIADRFGVSASTVLRLMRRSGAIRRAPTGPRHDSSPGSTRIRCAAQSCAFACTALCAAAPVDRDQLPPAHDLVR